MQQCAYRNNEKSKIWQQHNKLFVIYFEENSVDPNAWYDSKNVYLLSNATKCFFFALITLISKDLGIFM